MLSADLSRATVLQAAQRIAGRIRQTPTFRCEALEHPEGPELWIKAECLQHIGAFKARGALNALLQLDPTERASGVITYSSGNHAQALAWAARQCGVTARIAMPTNAPAVKVAAVRRLGGSIVFAGTTSDERRAAALELQREHGGCIIEPFDDPHIIAGAGTTTLELLAQVEAQSGGALDALLVQVGGGGLISGACLASEASNIAITSVEPIGCDAMAQSLAQGERVSVSPGPTLADGLRPTRVGVLNFSVARPRVGSCAHVDDDALGRAVRSLLLHAKLAAEPSGAAGLAAYMTRQYPADARRVGIIVSGGNLEPSLMAELLQRHGDDS